MSKKITLKLRDLTKGETLFREFDDEEATVAFLKDRPRLLDILGVVFEGLTPEQNARLRAAMRPLDAEEQAAEKRLDEEADKKAALAEEERAKEDAAARLAHIESMKTADPHRPMEIRYKYNTDIEPVDADDPRPITDETRQAIAAWIAERNEWVESRGQMVGEAKITVWPGNLPKPGADRVQTGTFIPCSAPAKK